MAYGKGRFATALAHFRLALLTSPMSVVYMDDDDGSKKKDDDDAKKDTALDKLLAKVDEACSKMDALGARMDSAEEKLSAMDKKRKDDDDDDDDDSKKDSARKDEPAEREEMKEKIKEKEEKKDDEEEEKKDAKKRKDDDDEDEPEKAKEVVADKKRAKKDDDDDDDDAKKDSRSDSDRVTRADLEALRRQIPRSLSDEEWNKFAKVQERADLVFSAFGDSAMRPLQGESLLGYRRRLADKLKPHSTAWKATDLSKINDDAAFSVIEDQIYADAARASENPVDLREGEFREVITPDRTGRRISTFRGKGSFVRQFKRQARALTGLTTRFENR